MTDTDTPEAINTPEPAAPQILGSAAFKKAQEEYRAVVDAAKAVRDEEIERAHQELSKTRAIRYAALDQIRTAAMTVFGSVRWDYRTEHLIATMDALTHPQTQKEEQAYNQAEKTASDTRNAAVRAAREARNKVAALDPFTQWVDTVLRSEYDNAADVIIAALPATIAQLNTLADERDWCTQYETFAQEAWGLGLITDTRESVYRVPEQAVPDGFNSQKGEIWERVLTLPAFYRLDMFSDDELRDRAVSTTYRRLSAAPDPEPGV